MVAMSNFDFRSVLGRWELVAQSFYKNPLYNSGTLTMAYAHGSELAYKYTGERIQASACSMHSGRVRQESSDVYRFVYRHDARVQSLGKFLYADASHLIILECLDDTVSGVCPEKYSAISLFSRSFVTSHDVIDRLKNIVLERTYGCHSMAKINRALPSTCPADNPPGKTSCTFQDIEQVPHLELTSLQGLWYLTGRSDSLEFKWDSGILHVTNEGAGRGTMKYTGLPSHQSRECLGPYEVCD